MTANVNKYIWSAVLGYGGSTLVSYKYNQYTKAQMELKEVTD